MGHLSKNNTLSLSAKIALDEYGKDKCVAAYEDYLNIHDIDVLAKMHDVHVDFILSLVNAGEELQAIK